ncbi:MAG: class I SAM-dependent methyltransferase [DPANN group archaeon]|nr:class I SAM-dependent methyltransferase [DPANN group archaeon]
MADYFMTKLDKNLYESKNPVVNYIFKNKIDKILDFAGIKKNHTVLDLGSGEGYITKILMSKSKDVYAVDIDFDKVKLLSKLNPKSSYANGSELPFKNESFDVIVCSEVMEHIKDLDYFLKNVRSVLKKNGVFIVTLPREKIITLGKLLLLRFNDHPHFHELPQIEIKIKEYFDITESTNTLFFVHKVMKCI